MAGKTAGWILMAGLILAGCTELQTGSGTGTGPGSASSTTGSSSTARSEPVVLKGHGLVAQVRPPVADLPVPVGFEILEAESRNYESAGARFVDHTYQGKADKFAVERFVREQLPGKGWTLRGSQMVRGTFFLKYDKGSEFLDVMISAVEPPILGPTVRLTYNLQTLGRGEPRR
jgi:hypothetical protein